MTGEAAGVTTDSVLRVAVPLVARLANARTNGMARHSSEESHS